jgi:hypothetical protein
MNITTSTLRMAFFRVYRELATAEAHSVSVHEVKDAWGATGLRHSDLPAVLQDLIRSRMLQPMEPDRIAAVRLNEAGVREYHERSGTLRRVADWLTLTRVELRRVGAAGAKIAARAVAGRTRSSTAATGPPCGRQCRDEQMSQSLVATTRA